MRKTTTQTPPARRLSTLTATPELVGSGGGPTDLVGFLHQVDLVELQDDGKVDGLLAHSTRLLVEVHLLEDLTGRTVGRQFWKSVNQNDSFFSLFLFVNKD